MMGGCLRAQCYAKGARRRQELYARSPRCGAVESPSGRGVAAPRALAILWWGRRNRDWLQRPYLIHVNERLVLHHLHLLPHGITVPFHDWFNVTLQHWHAFSFDCQHVRVCARKQSPQPKHTLSRLNT